MPPPATVQTDEEAYYGQFSMAAKPSKKKIAEANYARNNNIMTNGLSINNYQQFNSAQFYMVAP